MKGKFDNASESFRKLNPHLFGVGSVEAKIDKPIPGRALVEDLQARQDRSRKLAVTVSLIAFLRRPQDDDNLVRGFKPLRDAVARDLGIDDGDSRITFKYHQIETKGSEGVAVHLEATQ